MVETERKFGGPASMHHPTTVLAETLANEVSTTFDRNFGGRLPRGAEILRTAARLIMERLALSDALYHDAEHTALVTLVAQDILNGRRLSHNVAPDTWLHVVLATLTHDVGYVRGVCRNDRDCCCVINDSGSMIDIPRGASDAFLGPYHVERSKIFVRERFGKHDIIDAERLSRAIELTRFPVPDETDRVELDTEAAMVRAADLIGQLGDPLYAKKLNALFHEFAETGTNEALGYASPADLADGYPSFFWSKVEPFLTDAIQCLEMTNEGRVWLAHMYAHVCVIEHGRRHMGPSIGRPLPRPALRILTS